LPSNVINIGSPPSILHLTLLNLISLSITFGWNVISKNISSCAGILPFSGEIVKKCLQNYVSHSKFAGKSPIFTIYNVLVYLLFITTDPNPNVSSITFNSIPWHAPIIFSNFLSS